MSTLFDPQSLDVQAFARAATPLSGADELSAYARLTDAVPPQDGHAAVAWTAVGEFREPQGSPGQAWLHLTAQAAVPVVCQRCLLPMAAPVTVDHWFRFVADEATAEAQDDEAEEDLLVTSRNLDLKALVEDELLLGLPMVPMHDECPVPVKLEARDADFVDESAPEQHPFAALAGLKKLTGN